MHRFIDNESSRRELDTLKFAMPGAAIGRVRKYFGCHIGPAGLITGGEMSHHGRG
jgi:hypothetical protein